MIGREPTELKSSPVGKERGHGFRVLREVLQVVLLACCNAHILKAL